MRVAPAAAGGHEQVAASEAVLEPFQDAERVELAVDPALRPDHDPLPGRGQKILGSPTHVGPLLSFDGLEEAERLGRGAARVGRRELDRLQECGQEATHLAVPAPQILEVVVVGWPDQVGDLGHGLGELVPWDAGEDGVADATVGTPGVEQDEACLVEQQRGDVQILERAEASLLAGAFDAGEHRGDQLVEQVHDVIEGRGLLNLGEGEEGRVTAGRGHPGDGLRPCRGGEPAGAWTRGRHGGQIDVTHSQCPDVALLVGLTYAKSLSFASGVPLIAVNHIEGHIHAVIMESCRDGVPVAYPALALVVSGGHTHLFEVREGFRIDCWERPATTRPARPSIRSASCSGTAIRAAR